MKETLTACVLGLFVAAIIGSPIIKMLKRLHFGQKILEDGPTWHQNKQNTPTMGGLIFIGGALAALVYALIKGAPVGDLKPLYVFCLALIFGLIGFVDDFTKIRKKRNKGITAPQKLALQAAAAVLFITVMRITGCIQPEYYIPFFGAVLKTPWWLYFIFSVFIIVGADNAVNLTDGVDGLCGGVTLVVCAFFAALLLKNNDIPSAMIAAGLCGALGGFLIFNHNPAKVFMGDTGSLFLGGAVCALAFASGKVLVLIPVGIIYILETLSDILQVGWYKLSHGKRIFKMAPLHHHLELCGWSEIKIDLVFCFITVATSAAAYFFM